MGKTGIEAYRSTIVAFVELLTDTLESTDVEDIVYDLEFGIERMRSLVLQDPEATGDEKRRVSCTRTGDYRYECFDCGFPCDYHALDGMRGHRAGSLREEEQ